MNVSLTPELEKLVTRKVESGLYQSASEVIREGLRLLSDHDRMREVQLSEVQKKFKPASINSTGAKEFRAIKRMRRCSKGARTSARASDERFPARSCRGLTLLIPQTNQALLPFGGCVSHVRPNSGLTWVKPVPAGGLGMRMRCWQPGH
jgi:putative addiction module CopG family antidote